MWTLQMHFFCVSKMHEYDLPQSTYNLIWFCLSLYYWHLSINYNYSDHSSMPFTKSFYAFFPFLFISIIFLSSFKTNKFLPYELIGCFISLVITHSWTKFTFRWICIVKCKSFINSMKFIPTLVFYHLQLMEYMITCIVESFAILPKQKKLKLKIDITKLPWIPIKTCWK